LDDEKVAFYHHHHPLPHSMLAETASSGVAEAEMEVEEPKSNAVRNHWGVFTAYTHVASKYIFLKKKKVVCIHQRIDDPRDFFKDSANPRNVSASIT
jgi:hypothetical protein